MYWFLVIVAFLLAGIKTKKPKKYQKVSVIIPAYNEEDTVATVVEVVKKAAFVDEIIVVNDGSSDNTEAEAAKAGARVISHATNKGKGEALFTGYREAECDIIAFIDADIHNLTSSKVEAMIIPILEGKTDITKTKFARTRGRVTELTAKPLLNFFFPEITFEQPLSGQFAARKDVLKRINFEKDYGVDVGIVIDADVLGISITEVDIGAIEHDMSPLEDLNLMANEVVRTIMSRANKYGRVIMIDEIGHFIRMSIVGLSLVILGLFTIFFVSFVPLAVGIMVGVIGLIIAIYYIVKVIVKSIVMFRKTPKGNLVKSFIKIHFPLIISIVILLLMISTFIGAAHFDNGVLSIEPNSRNLIIYADDSPRDNTISVRGPYTVDVAVEDELDLIRMPADAMMTLGIKENDTIQIGDNVYTIENARDGEPNLLRLPKDAKNFLGLEEGSVIQNSRLKQVFEGTIMTHSYENENATVYEQYAVSSRDVNSSTYEIFLDNNSIANSSGIFKNNATYGIKVNDELATSFNFKEDSNVTFDYENHTVEVMFKDLNKTSIKKIPRESQGTFLNLNI